MSKKIVAVCNQKGGVGKTTATATLAWYLAKHNYKVILLDADPQANLTSDKLYSNILALVRKRIMDWPIRSV
ncbi:MAG: ParA family protein, partial [Candidatus Thorarchaeota archaeon]